MVARKGTLKREKRVIPAPAKIKILDKPTPACIAIASTVCSDASAAIRLISNKYVGITIKRFFFSEFTCETSSSRGQIQPPLLILKINLKPDRRVV